MLVTLGNLGDELASFVLCAWERELDLSSGFGAWARDCPHHTM
jgi:hypothetical protein